MLTTKGVKVLSILYRPWIRVKGLPVDEIKNRCGFRSELDAVATIECLIGANLIFKNKNGLLEISGAGELELKHERIYTRSFVVAMAACAASVVSLVVSLVALFK